MFVCACMCVLCHGAGGGEEGGGRREEEEEEEEQEEEEGKLLLGVRLPSQRVAARDERLLHAFRVFSLGSHVASVVYIMFICVEGV